ncbi:MAG: DUF2911 domain-containing protein [Flavobacteriales bacterium]|nr:DUF2911 domain-containing protein [Flavobacteriales bacterium]MCB9165918.1 DUF2911 domain-containing protein [Flavobacteriales bacterium]
MKTTLTTVLLGATMTALQAQDLPKPSPLGHVEQIVGLTKVSVDYSRPSQRGRKVFGELVPFDEIWRTGANQCTRISFDGPVQFGGKDVPAGTFALFTVPGTKEWTFILNKNTELWGASDHKQEEDILRVAVEAGGCDRTETFTIDLADVTDDGAMLQLRWENTCVGVPIKADATERGMANIREALSKPDADYRAYNSSATFYLDRGMSAEQALEWAQKSVSLEKKYWNLHTLARAQAASNMTKEAVKTAEESMALAQEAGEAGYVKKNKDAIEQWSMKH